MYSGLVDLLGAENVVDRPVHWPFHLPIKTYPKNMGYLGWSRQNAGIKQHYRRISLPFSAYDIVIVASCRTDCLAFYLDQEKKIPDRIPRIFLDGGDREEVCGDADRLGNMPMWLEIQKKRPFDLIFKREVTLGRDYPKEVVAFPFCINANSYPRLENLNQKWQVVFWATESHPIRTRAFEILNDHFDCNENGTVKNKGWQNYQYKGDRYFQELSRAAIAINLRGAGWDTLRYWEIPFLGPFMVTQNPKIQIDNNFMDGVHVAYCRDDLSDLIDICQYYLDHEEKRLSLAKAAREHLLRYHTNVARATSLLQTVKNRLGVGE